MLKIKLYLFWKKETNRHKSTNHQTPLRLFIAFHIYIFSITWGRYGYIYIYLAPHSSRLFCPNNRRQARPSANPKIHYKAHTMSNTHINTFIEARALQHTLLAAMRSCVFANYRRLRSLHPKISKPASRIKVCNMGPSRRYGVMGVFRIHLCYTASAQTSAHI